MIKTTLINEDCLEAMKTIPDQSIDMILTDPPYGTTAYKWDSVIPFEPMWTELNRIIKPNGCIALFGSEPFSSALRMSNIKNYKYDWIWLKNRSAGFIHAKNMPLKRNENISIFSLSSMGHKTLLKDNRMHYYPQGIKKIDKIHKRPNVFSNNKKTIIGNRPSHKKEFKVEYENYPTNILNIPNVHNVGAFHPTQKPVELLEYLIKTYTLEGETVLDFTMGSGSTGVACVNTNRNFTGIEWNPDGEEHDKYFKIAVERIEQTKKEKELELFKV